MPTILKNQLLKLLKLGHDFTRISEHKTNIEKSNFLKNSYPQRNKQQQRAIQKEENTSTRKIMPEKKTPSNEFNKTSTKSRLWKLLNVVEGNYERSK